MGQEEKAEARDHEGLLSIYGELQRSPRHFAFLQRAYNLVEKNRSYM